jgi:hypothetical protein
MKITFKKLCFAALLSLGLSAPAWSIVVADPEVCSDITQNHMTINTSWAISCLASGVGNIQGSDTDLFANGTDWKFIEKSEGGAATPLYSLSYIPGVGDATSITGSWSLSSSFWSLYDEAAVGFKFGTGNTPDEWFVFDVKEDSTGGAWTFFSELINGNGKGGLSHLNLYAKERTTTVSEPATLGLLGLGLLGLSLTRRRSAR